MYGTCTCILMLIGRFWVIADFLFQKLKIYGVKHEEMFDKHGLRVFIQYGDWGPHAGHNGCVGSVRVMRI